MHAVRKKSGRKSAGKKSSAKKGSASARKKSGGKKGAGRKTARQRGANPVYFRAANLIVTVLDKAIPQPGITDPCPSMTCCGPPSVTCFASDLRPRASMLGPDDLGVLIQDLRYKLGADRSGIDVVLVAKRPGQYEAWQNTLRRELGDPVSTIKP